MRKKFKILLAGSLLLGGFLVCYGPPAQCEIHTIPAGFEGTVRIFYNDPDAPVLPNVGGCRFHQIPSSGVLRTSDGPNHGWGLKQVFFRWDVNDELIALPIISPDQKSEELGIRERVNAVSQKSNDRRSKTVFFEYRVGRE